MLTILLEILLFAIATTILIAWGTIKKQRQSEELLQKLMLTCERKIVKAFETNELMRRTELEDTIRGTKASLFWSKHKAVIKDPTEILDKVLSRLIEQGKIVEGRQKTYTWIKGGDL